MSSVLPTGNVTQVTALGLLGCSPYEDAHRPYDDSQVDEAASAAKAAAPECGEDVVTTEHAPNASLTATAAKECGNYYHRVAQARIQQGISQRTVARRMGIELKKYRDMEDPSYDLSLSQLSALQLALDVPLIDLLEDRHELSRPVAERAKMVKVMKTAAALREIKSAPRTERLVRMLCEQLVDVMPELVEVSAWPQYGARRGQSAVGKALCQPIDMRNIGLPE